MAKKKQQLFIEIENEKDFDQILKNNLNSLICAEIYNSYAGSCKALDRLFTKIKLDWSDGKMILLKVPAERIESLRRFCGHSEPVYMFIINSKVTRVFRGVNNIRFGEITKEELLRFKIEQEGSISRPHYNLDEPTSEEMDWLRQIAVEREQEVNTATACRAARQAARKRHRAELMVPHLKCLNFVLYWPHRRNAHPELYERWDMNNIIMVGREEVTLTKDIAEDVLYNGDVPLNEASLQELLSGPALAICFRLLDTEKHFVSLVRRILYEEIAQYGDTKLPEDQRPQMTAFDFYSSYSPTRQQVWQRRREERARLKREAKENKTRRLSEMKRLAAQKKLDVIEARRVKLEQQKLELLKAGNLDAFQKLNVEGDEDNDDKESLNIPQEISDESEEISEDEDETEYFPPAGLLIPGLYSPPNDIAKTNGLAILFPKTVVVKRREEKSMHQSKAKSPKEVNLHPQLVMEYVTPQSEFLPPHVLVMLDVNKRHKAVSVLAKYKPSLIHMGIFNAISPYNTIHIAHSVKQYNAIADRISMNLDEIKIAFMVSVRTDLPLLELMDLNPVHVSRDAVTGEEECEAMFPIGYGDAYPEFEDFCK